MSKRQNTRVQAHTLERNEKGNSTTAYQVYFDSGLFHLRVHCSLSVARPRGMHVRRGRGLLLNGQAIMIKGVNRHEHDPYLGKTVRRAALGGRGPAPGCPPAASRRRRQAPRAAALSVPRSRAGLPLVFLLFVLPQPTGDWFALHKKAESRDALGPLVE